MVILFLQLLKIRYIALGLNKEKRSITKLNSIKTYKINTIMVKVTCTSYIPNNFNWIIYCYLLS